MKYWCQRRLVITVEGPQGRSSRTLDKPFARIGADAASEVVLADKQLERRCFYVHATEQGVFGMSLAPSGRSPGLGTGWLEPDQKLGWGAYQVSMRLDALPTGTRPTIVELDERGSGPRPYAEIRVSRKGQPVGVCQLTRALTLVGRSGLCRLRIHGASVSPTHCVLFWDAGQLWVIDLLSRTGTRHQGRARECTLLVPQESVELGHYTVTLLGSSGDCRVPPLRSCSAHSAESSWAEDAVDVQDFSPAAAEEAWPRVELAATLDQLRVEQAQWAAERECQERGLADRARQLAAEAAQLAAAQAAFVRARESWEEEQRRSVGEMAPRVERPTNEIAGVEGQRQTHGGGDQARSEGVEESASPEEASPGTSPSAGPSPAQPQPISSSNSTAATADIEVADEDEPLDDLAASVTDRLVALHHSKRARRRRWGQAVLLVLLLVIAGLIAAYWNDLTQDWKAWLETITG